MLCHSVDPSLLGNDSISDNQKLLREGIEMGCTFTLRYQLTSGEGDTAALLERSAEDGCDDASVGVGEPGRLALEFVRETPSACDATEGAIKDMRRRMGVPRGVQTRWGRRGVSLSAPDPCKLNISFAVPYWCTANLFKNDVTQGQPPRGLNQLRREHHEHQKRQ